MRWNCPHCGIGLQVSDDKISPGWSFTRCYECSGFAMIRRPDINLIKVNEAPPGEALIYPEVNKTRGRKRKPKNDIVPQSANSSATAAENSYKIASPLPSVNGITQTPYSNGRIPEPLPEQPKKREFKLPRLPKVKLPSSATVIGSLSAVALVGGFLLVAEGIRSFNTVAPKKTVVVDDLPEVETSEVEAVPEPVVEPKEVVEISLSDEKPEESIKTTATAPERDTIPDESIGRAPAVEPKANSAANKASYDDGERLSPSIPRLITLNRKSANLRAGPGLQYPIIGVAQSKMKYVVQAHYKRWYQVVAAPHKNDPYYPKAWIRNDMTKAITR